MRRLVLALAACLAVSPMALPAANNKPPKVKKQHTQKVSKARKAPKVRQSKHPKIKNN
jgi:hypothetical protein